MVDASPGVKWDDVAGLLDAKRVLQENVVLPLLLPEFFQGIRRPIKARRLAMACPSLSCFALADSCFMFAAGPPDVWAARDWYDG